MANSKASRRFAVATLSLAALIIVGVGISSAHSTHSGIVSWNGCNVNPKKPIYQTAGREFRVWGVARIGEGCTNKRVDTYVVYNPDNKGWVRTGRYGCSGCRQITVQSVPILTACNTFNRLEVRSSVRISWNGSEPSSDYHRDADEHLTIFC